MFNRIKTGIKAVVGLVSSFVFVSCNQSSGVFFDDVPTEYGAPPYHYDDFCTVNLQDNNAFYANLCADSIRTFAKINGFDSGGFFDERDPEIQTVVKMYDEAFSFAEKCCQSLKPKELESNGHYCHYNKDSYPVPHALGCDTYRACILDIMLHKNGKDHPLCMKTREINDANNVAANNAVVPTDTASESAPEQAQENK